jgi:glycosyltransferase involved in cell wall biosynthesis
VSDAVKQDLIMHCGIAASDIDVVRNFLPTDRAGDIKKKEARDRVRKALGLTPDCLLVVGCGTTRPIKGPDLFVAAAAEVDRCIDGCDVQFVWVGGAGTGPQFDALVSETAKRGVAGSVRFLGHRSDYLQFLAAADVFVMSSREDPAPLVVLEAASMGVPTVCFTGAGGAPEFVREDAGICVAREDTQAMASAIRRLLESRPLREALGACARGRVHLEHTPAVGARQVEAIILDIIASSRARVREAGRTAPPGTPR